MRHADNSFSALTGRDPGPTNTATPTATPTDAQRNAAARALAANPMLITTLNAAGITFDEYAVHGETARAAADAERAYARSKLAPQPSAPRAVPVARAVPTSLASSPSPSPSREVAAEASARARADFERRRALAAAGATNMDRRR